MIIMVPILLLLNTFYREENIEVKNVYAVSRAVEETNFANHLDNKRMMFHASRPSNFVGILSR